MATLSSDRRRPAPGDILPYSFLWSHEFDVGRDDAVKERPCVVVLAVGAGENPTVTVAPITSREPERPGAIPLKPGAPGLDRASWIIPWELNTFRWLGPDVGAAPVRPSRGGVWGRCRPI
jgi:mRNA-degrading endonuclease toxin of MazEF toxin-antitoxin module